MLNVMRDNLKNLKWVLWIVAFSMVLYLGYFFGGSSDSAPTGPWAAKVGDQIVSRADFRTRAENLERQYRQMFGDRYADFKPQLRLGTQAIQGLIDRQLILTDAGRMGLAVSAEDLGREIQADPQFHDAGGRFIGTQRYVELVNRAFGGRGGGGVEAYEDAVRKDMIIDRWIAAVTQSLEISDSELEELHRERTERTEVDYVLFASADQDVSTAVSDDDLRGWYEAHTDDYRRADARELRYVVVDREAQRAAVEITDAEIQQAYDDNQANYSHPEQVRARHILFRLDPGTSDEDKTLRRGVAEDVRRRLVEGADFAEVAKATSQDTVSAQRGGDLGWFSREDMVEPFAEAAFSTPVGELSPVVETPFGFHIIQVEDRRDAGVTPLADLSDEIRRSLATRRAQERVVAEAERIAAEADSADALASVAAENGLEVQALTIARDGDTSSIGAAPDFLSTVFELPVGGVSAPLRVARGMAVVAVDAELPASVAPLDEVRDRVKTDVLNDRTRQAALAAAEKALASSRPLDRVAERAGVEFRKSGPIGPGQDLPGTGGAAAALRPELFGPGVEVGDTGVIQVPAGAIVYRVTSREPFDAAAFELAKADLRRELAQQRREVIVGSIVTRLRDETEIVVNQEIVGPVDG